MACDLTLMHSLYTVKVMPPERKGKEKALKLYTATVSHTFYSWLWLNWNMAQAGTAKNFYSGLRLRISTAAYGSLRRRIQGLFIANDNINKLCVFSM